MFVKNRYFDSILCNRDHTFLMGSLFISYMIASGTKCRFIQRSASLNMIEPDAVLFRIFGHQHNNKVVPTRYGGYIYNRSYPHIAGHLLIGSIYNDRRVAHHVWCCFCLK